MTEWVTNTDITHMARAMEQVQNTGRTVTNVRPDPTATDRAPHYWEVMAFRWEADRMILETLRVCTRWGEEHTPEVIEAITFGKEVTE